MSEKVVSLVRWIGAGAWRRLSVKNAKFQWTTRVAIPNIIAQLGDSMLDVREEGANALLKLSEQAEFRESLGPAIPQVIALLSHDMSPVCEKCADILSKLSEQAEFQESIQRAIPRIIALLSHRKSSVRIAGACALLKLSEQTEFRESIGRPIPQIIALLSDNMLHVREEGANVLSKLSEQAEFRESIGRAIPRIIALLSHDMLPVREEGVNALLKLSEQEVQETIRLAIPQIIALLSDSTSMSYVCEASADVLSKLSEQAEFRESIRLTIPHIIALLSHCESSVRLAGVDALSKLSKQAEFRESIRPAILHIIALLSDTECNDIRQAGANALSKLSEQAKFRESIRPAVPRIIALLSHRESSVRIAGADALSKLSEQAEFRESIRLVIPQIIALLSHDMSPVCEKGAGVLSKLSEQAEFRESIRPAVPRIINLLSHHKSSVRIAGADALSKLSEQAECQESIRTAIPHIIALLSHSMFSVRMKGIYMLSKLSEQAELRESIGRTIPHIITLLSNNEPSVRKAGADALSKLSGQAEFRESIGLAIPHIIALLGNTEPYVREAGADALSILSEQAEFRESIRPAIPHIIALLSHCKLSVRTAGQNALSKLSKQSEFRESIQSAIPEIIALLSDKDEEIRKVAAHVFCKISEQAEFRESVAAISQNTALLCDINNNVHMAAVAALAKRPEQGINADTAYDIADSDMSEYFQTITCWIAAEHALHYAKSKISAVSDVLKTQNIQESEYVVLAGFDESLIKSGIGYLEQIHVFVSAEIDDTSPLLSELGRIFTPFSSILFTESSSYRLPVFKDDVNVWEFDELVYFTASKFADGGSSAKTPLTVISLAHTPLLADSSTDSSPGGSGSGKGDKNEKQRSEKGKERDRRDEGEADKGDKNDKDPGDDPGKPSADKTNAGPREISFEIASEIYPNQDEQNAFQTLTMQGCLTIKTTPLAQSPPQFSKRDVKLAELTFCTEPTTDIAYKQIHIRVVVDSQQENARIYDIKPKRSQDSNGKEKQLSSTKTSWNHGVTTSVTLPHPQVAITGAAMKRNEETAGSEKIRYTSRITEHHSDGVVRWGFNVDDINLQERGIDMPVDILPAVHFEFFGDSDVLPAPPPERMDIVTASYWSIILPSEPKSTWIRKFLRLFSSSGNTQTTSYSNLFQIVALKTVPSNLPNRSYYRATVEVRSGASGSPKVKRPTADSANVTPAVVDGPQKLSTFDLPAIANFELSDHCIPILGNPGRDSKSH